MTLWYAGGKPKNYHVIANAGKDVLARCTLFRNVSLCIVVCWLTLYVAKT